MAPREFHKTTGHNKQLIKKGDVVVVYDNTPRFQWKLAIIEDLIKDNDSLVRPAHIIVELRDRLKLYPLEVVDSDSDQSPVDSAEQQEQQPDDDH